MIDLRIDDDSLPATARTTLLRFAFWLVSHESIRDLAEFSFDLDYYIGEAARDRLAGLNSNAAREALERYHVELIAFKADVIARLKYWGLTLDVNDFDIRILVHPRHPIGLNLPMMFPLRNSPQEMERWINGLVAQASL